MILQVDDHRNPPTKGHLGDLARRMHVKRDDLDEVLGEWTPEEFLEHLSRFTAADLTPPVRGRTT